MVNAKAANRTIVACVVAAVVVVAAALGLFLSAESRSRLALENVTISTAHYPLSALIYIAQEKGYFAIEGLNVKLRRSDEGKISIGEVLAGEADLGGAADTSVMYAVTAGAPLSIIAVIGDSTGENTVLGRKDRGVRRLDDLRGKKVGLSKGTSSQYYFDRLLLELGIAEAEVQVIDTHSGDIVAALHRGKLDAIVTWTPYLAQAEAKLGANAARLPKDGLAKITWSLFGTPQYVHAHPQAVKAVLRALVRAESWLVGDPDAARRLVAKQIGIDPASLAGAWPTYHFEVALDQSLIVALEEQSRWAIRKRLVPVRTTPNFLAAIDASFLLDVRPETVQIVR